MLKRINIRGENRLEYLNSLLNEKNDDNSKILYFINYINSSNSDDDEINFKYNIFKKQKR